TAEPTPKCFTIESLVGKDGSSHGGGSGEEPIRPTALRFPDSLHPATAAGVFGSCFQGSNGRTLFPDMVLQEPGTHAQGPGGLPLHPLQIPPQSFFSPSNFLFFRPNRFLISGSLHFCISPKSSRNAFINLFLVVPYVCLCVQVKVWFQNRRTKHKRQKLEEESPEAQQKRKGSQHVSRWRAATQQASGEDVDVISED
uniref:Homeobox domain-containing protein n=1 Tax=Neolamprologus brichardi TaxID=32507 RepID=A0A3Q4HKV2_NEOBR